MAARHRRFGEASKLPSGRWRARYWGPDGVRYSAPATFPDRKAADWFLTDMQRAVDKGTWTPPQPKAADTPALVTNFAEYAEQRIDARAARVVKPLKPSTVDLYRKLLRVELGPAFGALDLAAITPARVHQWHAASLKRGHPTQTGNAYQLLRSLMVDAAKVGLIKGNPADIEGAGKPDPKRRGEVLTHAELAAYLAAIPEARRMPLLLMAATGLRVGECLALRRSDVDLGSGEVAVRRTVARIGGEWRFGTPKTRAGERTVFLPSGVRDALRGWIDTQPMRGREALLFPASDGVSPMFETVLRQGHAKGMAAIGREATMHDLRRTAATLAAQNGATVRELMRLLGHTTPAVAMIYQRAEAERMKAIAAGWDAAHRQAVAR